MSRLIVGLSGRAGSGKSTAAEYLIHAHGFQRARFAGPLKDMMRALGLSEREIEGDMKEQPCAMLGGKTPRHAMQTIGTDWGRDMISPTLWVDAWKAAIGRLPRDVRIVCEDCRFENEAAAIHELGGIIIRIERAGSGQAAAGHRSEDLRFDADITVPNDGSVTELCGRIEAVLAGMDMAA